MSDFDAPTPREEPQDGAHDAVRDALPAFLHRRVSASERADVEAHLAHCDACDAELRTLASVRDLYTATAPTVAVDRIAATVCARTIVAAPVPRRAPTPRLAPATVIVRRRGLPAWARARGVRALAAGALLAVGSGTLLYHTPAAAPVRAPLTVAANATAAPVTTSTLRDPSGTLLGASFADLSDSELAAVVAAVDDPASSVPAAEPAPVSPSVLTPDGE